MKFQLAIDTGDINGILDTIKKTVSAIDIVEIGTPLIMAFGMEPVRRVKAEYPELCVLADTKIMDAGFYEAKIAFDAGADIVTVMGVSNDETVKGAVDSAGAAGGRILADMMCVPDLFGRAKQLKKLGADYLCVHTAKDIQSRCNPYNDLVIVKDAVGASFAAIAGGVNIDAVSLLKQYEPGIVIIGEAVTGKDDIKTAAADIRAEFDSAE